MIQEKERLEKLQERASERLVNVSEGTLRLSKSQGSVQYYHCKKGGPHNGKQRNRIMEKDYKS